jgi:hypothetical protein
MRLPRETQVYCFVMLFAIVGRPDLMARAQSLFRAAYPAYMWDMWLGSAYLNSGDQENARLSFQASMQYGDAVQHAFVQRHIEMVQKASRSPLTDEQQASLAHFEGQWEQITNTV